RGSALPGFEERFGGARAGNGELRGQCDDLSQQVQRLAGQVDHLSRLFITNSR
ncbi:MbeD/MobD family mobilization/exclusion protein, partial [Escherichia coli]|uniref:MbeD/MobD family mobilization/exclusion protein n=1 Tax=Escherichia coli TaxID=562 RepID=UPI002546483E